MNYGRPTGNAIRKLCKEGRLTDAFQAVDFLVQQGLGVSSNIFYCLLQSCIDKKDLSVGKEFQGLLLRSGFLSNAFLGCHLIRMFAACGSLFEANRVFYNVPEKNVFTWSAIISAYTLLGQCEQAIKLYHQMQESSVKADEHAFVAVLRACSSMAAVEQGRLIHSNLIESGLESDVYAGSALIDMYARCGSLEDGLIILGKLSKTSVVTWNAMIGGYAQHGCGQEALDLFHQMQQQNTQPNAITFVCVLKACSSIAALGQGKLVHAYAVESGVESDVYIGSTLVIMYAKCGRLADAQNVFDKLSKHDIVTWSAMIAGYVQHGRCQEALQLFEQMQKEGIEPNNVIFVSIVKACSSIAAEHQCNIIHGQIVRSGYDSDIFVGSTLVDMYVKFGSLEKARKVFDKLTQQSVVTWSTMITGYAQHGFGREAIELFEHMQEEGVVPNNVTLFSILKACTSLAALSKGKLIHLHLMESGNELDIVGGIILVDMYTKCGSLEDACTVFEKLPEKSVETWSAMIAGCAQHSDYKLAMQYFESMEQLRVLPDEITYVCLLSACSHAGQVDEGCLHFKSMIEQYGITPSIDHYNCMVNLLGQAGFLIEAQELLLTMPFFPNVVGWTALISHCKTCNNVEVGRHCFDQLVSIDQSVASGYKLMLDIYGSADMQEDAHSVYDLKKCVHAWKKPGKASIELNNMVHYFVVSDRGHIQIVDIDKRLDSLNIHMRVEGYVPHLNLMVEPKSHKIERYMICEE